MHDNVDINIEQLSKTEGHADLHVKVRNGKVEDVKLKISENKRFYTQAVRKRHYSTIPQFVSRICGTCSIAHLTCSIKAVEKSFKIQPSEQTKILRKLSVYGMMIRDHALHLYFFCLPDVFGKDSIFDFDESKDNLIKQAFAVKSAGNNLSKVIAGRAVHPTFQKIGHFSHIPSKEEIKDIKNQLKNTRKYVFELIDIFYNSNFEFARETNFMSLISNDYSFLEGDILTSGGLKITEENFWTYLERIVIPYSQATGFKFSTNEYMVGALARMNLSRDKLSKESKEDLSPKYLKIFPSNNIYHNNLAQAIEILHCIDHSIQLLEENDFKSELPPKINFKGEGEERTGIGVIEAPRGTLYHHIDISKDSKVTYANFVIPTAQNQIKMENDIRLLLPTILDKSKHEIHHELEKVIRAYDPCMSCASHFLKLKWI
ncbi:MAG TPA: nickel-dependent hydrogenase large subunit [Nitrososphaeraceae archaeon]|jgi:coenzyme F420-reducing hydrogenase alpha subunit|nr:nickel-dependent hydrogenase large subunit [Nitrososphaeraceae archaeon]